MTLPTARSLLRRNRNPAREQAESERWTVVGFGYRQVAQPTCTRQARSVVLVDVHEATTSLSRLIARVEAGERVVIARAGEPIVELVPVHRTGVRIGTAAGTVRIADAAFEWSDAEIAEQFYDPD